MQLSFLTKWNRQSEGEKTHPFDPTALQSAVFRRAEIPDCLDAVAAPRLLISILGGYRDRHGEGNLRKFLACPTANPGDKRRHGQDTCECEKTSAFPFHRKHS